MPTHSLIWKTVRCKTIRGSDMEAEIPALINLANRGALLSKILEMPRKQPVSFESAVRAVIYQQAKERDARNFGDEPGQHRWYATHFTEWISSLGFHIELTGDEFDVVNPSQRAV